MTEPRTVAFRTADGIDLAADRYGDPTRGSVLLAHGGGQTRYAWAKTAAALGALGWEAISVDLRGHGDSGWSPTGDYQIERFAEDLAGVAREIGGQPALIGASFPRFYLGRQNVIEFTLSWGRRRASPSFGSGRDCQCDLSPTCTTA